MLFETPETTFLICDNFENLFIGFKFLSFLYFKVCLRFYVNSDISFCKEFAKRWPIRLPPTHCLNSDQISAVPPQTATLTLWRFLIAAPKADQRYDRWERHVISDLITGSDM